MQDSVQRPETLSRKDLPLFTLALGWVKRVACRVTWQIVGISRRSPL